MSFSAAAGSVSHSTALLTPWVSTTLAFVRDAMIAPNGRCARPVLSGVQPVGGLDVRPGFLLIFATTVTVLGTLHETVQMQLCATIVAFLDTSQQLVLVSPSAGIVRSQAIMQMPAPMRQCAAAVSNLVMLQRIAMSKRSIPGYVRIVIGLDTLRQIARTRKRVTIAVSLGTLLETVRTVLYVTSAIK